MESKNRKENYHLDIFKGKDGDVIFYTPLIVDGSSHNNCVYEGSMGELVGFFSPYVPHSGRDEEVKRLCSDASIKVSGINDKSKRMEIESDLILKILGKWEKSHK